MFILGVRDVNRMVMQFILLFLKELIGFLKFGVFCVMGCLFEMQEIDEHRCIELTIKLIGK